MAALPVGARVRLDLVPRPAAMPWLLGEPQQLAPELVNRYRAVKRAGLL